jgi:hypothetical protein
MMTQRSVPRDDPVRKTTCARASFVSDGEIDAASAAYMWQTVTVTFGLIIIGRRVGT